MFVNGIKGSLIASYELGKLKTVEYLSEIISKIISKLLLLLVIIFILFFISMFAGFYLSVKLGDSYSGFAIVAGFYSLILLILVIGKKKIVETPIQNKIIFKVFGKK